MPFIGGLQRTSSETLQEWLTRLLKVDREALTPNETNYLLACTNVARATIRVEQLEQQRGD